MFIINRIMLGDSYKYSHYRQYPIGAKNLYDYAEARSVKAYENTLFFGLQAMLKLHFTDRLTMHEVVEAEQYAKAHGIPFDLKGWTKIVTVYNGHLPVRIKAVKEGTLVQNKNVLYTIELIVDDSEIVWLPSWLETFLMKVWYTCNVATRSFYIKAQLMDAAKQTSDAPFVDFQFHNFGDRGSSSVESAMLGGAAHLSCFLGTDNFHSLKLVNYAYGDDINTIGYSIPATEHSTTSSWGREAEFDMVMNHLEANKDAQIIAAVGDTYDIFEFTKRVTSGEFKQKIESDNYPTFVIRPDSGYPADVLMTMINIMEANRVEFTTNDKGFKVFKKYRIIWGDGITEESISSMLGVLAIRKYSSENISFGSGGWLMQQHDRDTLGFAIKCSNITLLDGSEREVYKDPITDQGKKSKKGKVTLLELTPKEQEMTRYRFFSAKLDEVVHSAEALVTVYEHGAFMNQTTLKEVRERVNAELHRFLLEN